MYKDKSIHSEWKHPTPQNLTLFHIFSFILGDWGISSFLGLAYILNSVAQNMAFLACTILWLQLSGLLSKTHRKCFRFWHTFSHAFG
jgi:hypothetical protein